MYKVAIFSGNRNLEVVASGIQQKEKYVSRASTRRPACLEAENPCPCRRQTCLCSLRSCRPPLKIHWVLKIHRAARTRCFLRRHAIRTGLWARPVSYRPLRALQSSVSQSMPAQAARRNSWLSAFQIPWMAPRPAEMKDARQERGKGGASLHQIAASCARFAVDSQTLAAQIAASLEIPASLARPAGAQETQGAQVAALARTAADQTAASPQKQAVRREMSAPLRLSAATLRRNAQVYP